jgi:hypothetical protein
MAACRSEAILECSDTSPLLNEAARRLVEKHGPARPANNFGMPGPNRGYFICICKSLRQQFLSGIE